jgi:hypothetical protein
MLTMEQKKTIIEAFPQLTRKDVSLGRINYHYEDSAYDKKIVVYHLHPNGNGFVYAGQMGGYDTDDKGFVNIRDYSEEQLRDIVSASIRSLGPKSVKEHAVSSEAEAEERWIGPDGDVLLLTYENELWMIYSGLNLEAAFETYEEAEQYMKEEQFRRSTV